jgi:hypothetical protein
MPLDSILLHLVRQGLLLSRQLVSDVGDVIEGTVVLQRRGEVELLRIVPLGKANRRIYVMLRWRIVLNSNVGVTPL